MTSGDLWKIVESVEIPSRKKNLRKIDFQLIFNPRKIYSMCEVLVFIIIINIIALKSCLKYFKDDIETCWFAFTTMNLKFPKKNELSFSFFCATLDREKLETEKLIFLFAFLLLPIFHLHFKGEVFFRNVCIFLVNFFSSLTCQVLDFFLT